MSPTDFFLLSVSLAFAAASIAVHGRTLNAIGPALFATVGGFWQLAMQWLRHRSWLQHRASGVAPSTQPSLCLALPSSKMLYEIVSAKQPAS